MEGGPAGAGEPGTWTHRRLPGIPDKDTAYAFKGEALLWTLILGSTVFAITITLYSIIHRFKIWPRVFSPRTFLYPNRTPIESTHRFFFSWAWEIYKLSDDEILRTVGLDALVFLRTQRFYAFLFMACAVFGLGVLMPLNLAYGKPPVNDGDYYSFFRTTMANLPRRNEIRNVHVYRTNIAALWLFTAATIVLLVLEYRHYIDLRFKWLTLARTHNYSVMVTSIPENMRDVGVLKRFFDRLLAPHGSDRGESVGRVICVTLTMNLKRLEMLVQERERVYERLEHALALLALPEDKLWPRTWSFNWEYQRWRRSKVQQVTSLGEKLQVLNEVVECVQEEVRRKYYGYNDPKNFGLLDVEAVVPALQDEEEGAGAGAGGGGAAACDSPAPPLGELAKGRRAAAASTSTLLKAKEVGTQPSCSTLASDADTATDGGISLSSLRLPTLTLQQNGGPKRPPRETSMVVQASMRVLGDPMDMDMDMESDQDLMLEEGEEEEEEEAQAHGEEEDGAGPGPGQGQQRDRAGLQREPSPGMPLTQQPSSGRGSGRGRGRDGEGEYGSFSPTALVCLDKPASKLKLRPQTQELLQRFRRKPIAGEMYSTAFVTVSTLEATAVLRQTVTYQRAFELFVGEAPLPEDILWANVDNKFFSTYLRRSLGDVLTICLTLAFTVPTAFISALNSVETLKKYIPWIDKYLHTGSEVRKVNKTLALVSPLLLLILISIIPPILGLLTRSVLRDSRTVSQAHYNIFKRYFGFLFYNALWVFVISSGIYETILSTYSNPSQVLLQIGNTLPKPAAFFINFIVIKALTGLPTELIRSNSFLTHLVKVLLVDELTEQNRRKVVIGCPSIRHPGGFPYGKYLAEHTLVYVYVVCYACLVPLILPAGLVFFAGSYLVYKRQLLFVYEPEYETGGEMFKLVLRYTFAGLFASQFVMLCMLVTKFAYEDLWCFLPLPLATYFAMDVVTKWYGRLEQHVPLNLAVSKDMRFWQGPNKAPTTQSGEVLDLQKDTYHHPAVRAPWCELSRPLPSPAMPRPVPSSVPSTASPQHPLNESPSRVVAPRPPKAALQSYVRVDDESSSE